jgi:hypothetical protein
MPQLLGEWSKSVAEAMWSWCSARAPGRDGREVPLVIRRAAREIDRHCMQHFAVPREIIHGHASHVLNHPLTAAVRSQSQAVDVAEGQVRADLLIGLSAGHTDSAHWSVGWVYRRNRGSCLS